METPKREFKGVWIPAKIWLDRNLSMFQKFLLAEIDSLSGDNGCFASNQYLADSLGSTAGSVKVALSRLRKMGYINESDYDGQARKIRVQVNGWLPPGYHPLTPTLAADNLPPTPSDILESTSLDKRRDIIEADASILKASPELPGLETPPTPAPPPREKKGAAPPPRSPHAAFVSLWHDAYKEEFHRPYVMAGGKDGSAIKRLFTATQSSPDALLNVARRAWRHLSFNCRQGRTMAGFASRFNDIMAELELWAMDIDPDVPLNRQKAEAESTILTAKNELKYDPQSKALRTHVEILTLKIANINRLLAKKS